MEHRIRMPQLNADRVRKARGLAGLTPASTTFHMRYNQFPYRHMVDGLGIFGTDMRPFIIAGTAFLGGWFLGRATPRKRR